MEKKMEATIIVLGFSGNGKHFGNYSYYRIKGLGLRV